jgi:hypothetical protein
MNAKKICAILIVVGLVMPVAALASLPAPENLTVAPTDDSLFFDWNDVPDAVKYSLDIEGTVTYWATVIVDEVETQVETTVEVGVSFGTSDRTDGGLMGDSNLMLAIDDIIAAIAAELGVDVEDLISIEDPTAKVKALSPGKGQGSQNNPFSDPIPLI